MDDHNHLSSFLRLLEVNLQLDLLQQALGGILHRHNLTISTIAHSSLLKLNNSRAIASHFTLTKCHKFHKNHHNFSLMLGLMIVKDRFSSHNLNFQEFSQAMSDSRSQLLDQNCLTPPSISPRLSQVTIHGAPKNNSSNPLSQNIQLLRIPRPHITNTTRVTRHIIHGLIKEMAAMMIPKMTLILRCSLKS